MVVLIEFVLAFDFSYVPYFIITRYAIGSIRVDYKGPHIRESSLIPLHSKRSADSLLLVALYVERGVRTCIANCVRIRSRGYVIVVEVILAPMGDFSK